MSVVLFVNDIGLLFGFIDVAPIAWAFFEFITLEESRFVFVYHLFSGNTGKEQQLDIDRLKAQEKRLEKLEQIISKMNK